MEQHVKTRSDAPAGFFAAAEARTPLARGGAGSAHRACRRGRRRSHLHRAHRRDGRDGRGRGSLRCRARRDPRRRRPGLRLAAARVGGRHLHRTPLPTRPPDGDVGRVLRRAARRALPAGRARRGGSVVIRSRGGPARVRPRRGGGLRRRGDARAPARRPLGRERAVGRRRRGAHRSRGARRPPRNRPRDARPLRRSVPRPHHRRLRPRASASRGWRDRVPVHQLHPLAVHAAGHGPSYGRALVEAAEETLALV